MTEPFQPHRIQPPVTPPAIPDALLPGEGRPPLQSSGVFVADSTRKQLQVVGWQDGDPIPPDLGEKLRQLQQKIRDEEASVELKDTALAEQWQEVKPKFTDISSLPPEKQAEVQAYLQNYKEIMAAQKQQQEELQRVDSQIPASIQGQSREEMRKQILESERAKRELEQQWAAQPTAQPTAQPAAQPASQPASQPTAQPAAQPASQPTAQPAAQPAEDATITPAATCARCGWPQDKPADVELTQLDKENYLVALLAQQRFEKIYSILHGRMQVRFRTLLTQETRIVEQQMGAMVRSGEIAGDGEYWLNRLEFELAATVQTISVDNTVIYTAAPASEFPRPEGLIQPTILPAMREHLFEKGLPQETVRRVVSRKFREFMSLVGRLEALVDSENF